MPSYSRQTPDHDANHTNPNHCLTVIQADLIIPVQAPRLVQPAESALDHPAPGQHLEAFDLIAAADNLHSQFAEGTQLFHPVEQGSEITPVGPNELHSSI